jgi:TonB family protein
MILPNDTLYAPYGASELKACYQRHLLYGMMLTSGGVLLAVVLSWVVSCLLSMFETPVIDVPPDNPVIIVTTLPIQPSVVWPRPDFDIRQPRQTDPDRGGQLVPVADTELADDGDLLPTRDEAIELIGGGGTGEGGYDSSWSFDASTTLEPEPAPDSFIACEVYPEMVYEIQPEYPRLAQRMGLGGVVHIKALVGMDGSVRKAMIYRSSGNESLDEAALEAAPQNRFKPALQNGQPVAVWVVYKVEFSLE